MSRIRSLPWSMQRPGQPLLMSVEQYDEMIRRGIIAEDLRVELLRGKIVPKNRAADGQDIMSIGPRHAYSVEELSKFKPAVASLGYNLRIQQPIFLDDLSKPEPDGSIVVGENQDYVDSDVPASDVLVVIEVADSSLQLDRGEKLGMYADAGIPTYVILNLLDKTAEVYSDPQKGSSRYATTRTLARTATLTLSMPKRKSLKLALSKLIAK